MVGKVKRKKEYELNLFSKQKNIYINYCRSGGRYVYNNNKK